jgi:hypothetical protein
MREREVKALGRAIRKMWNPMWFKRDHLWLLYRNRWYLMKSEGLFRGAPDTGYVKLPPARARTIVANWKAWCHAKDERRRDKMGAKWELDTRDSRKKRLDAAIRLAMK